MLIDRRTGWLDDHGDATADRPEDHGRQFAVGEALDRHRQFGRPECACYLGGKGGVRGAGDDRQLRPLAFPARPAHGLKTRLSRSNRPAGRTVMCGSPAGASDVKVRDHGPCLPASFDAKAVKGRRLHVVSRPDGR